MTIESTIMVLTFLSSAVALYFSLRKQRHEEQEIDADTISKLYDLVDKQDKRYQALRKEFDDYKFSTGAQIADIASDNVKLRRWAKRLVAQLEAAGILPCKFEE